MKRKTKLVTSIAAATAIAAGAAGFSTYAWLAVQRTVEGQILGVSAATTSANLIIDLNKNLTNDKGAEEQYSLPKGTTIRNKSEVQSTMKLSDVSSGTGMKLYKPTWRPSMIDYQASSIASVKTVAYYGYTLTAKNEKVQEGETMPGLDVFINSFSITPKDENEAMDKNLAKSVRASIIALDDNTVASTTYDKAGADHCFVIQNVDENDSVRKRDLYIEACSEGEKLEADKFDEKENKWYNGGEEVTKADKFRSASGTRSAYGEASGKFKLSKFSDYSTEQFLDADGIKTHFNGHNAVGHQPEAKTTEERKKQSQYVCSIEGGKSKYIMVAVWMEGSLKEDQNDALGGYINIDFGLEAYDSIAKKDAEASE